MSGGTPRFPRSLAPLGMTPGSPFSSVVVVVATSMKVPEEWSDEPQWYRGGMEALTQPLD